MALKFLNKKGWHTGSLRNIENVWKAEQKHDAEQKKLEELRKQIQEERERSEFRLLQQQAGLVPKQERLDFLYDSGLAVGKGNSDGFKTLEALPKPEVDTTSSTKPQPPSAPGALFEEKPQSANDAWRKLHSDPLLLIRQREQEALSKIKNNPVQMAMIRKSVEAKKQDKPKDKEHKKDSRKKSKYRKHSPSRGESDSEDDPGRDRHKNTKHGKHSRRGEADYEDAGSDGELRKKRTRPDERNHGDHPSRGRTDSKAKEERRNSKYDKYSRRGESDSEDSGSEGKQRRKRASFDDNNNGEHPSRGRTYQKAEGERRNPKYDTHSRRGEADSEDFGRESKGREKRASVDDNNNGEHPSRGRTYQKAEEERRYSKYDEKHSRRGGADSEDSASEGKQRKKRASVDDNNHGEPPSRGRTYLKAEEETKMRSHQKTTHEKLSTEKNHVPTAGHSQTSRSKPRQGKLSEEERAARLREMELDAKVHEEQRWKRLKKASDMDSLEASQERSLGGRSFLDAAQKSVYGAEKGGSSTIEESVRRRKYFMQGRSEAGEGSAFRR